MDGTATGVLGDLPDFQRPKLRIDSAQNTAKAQHVLPNKDVRKYVHSFFKAAASHHKDESFQVQMPSPDIAEEVANLFFYRGPEPHDASHGSFLHLLFQAVYDSPGTYEAIIDVAYNSSPAESYIVRYRVRHILLRIALADFSSSCLYESVPVAFLTNRRQRFSSIRIANALDSFRNCSHFSGHMAAASVDHVCSTCTDELVNVVSNEAEWLSTPVRVVSGIVEAQYEKDSTPIRVFAR